MDYEEKITARIQGTISSDSGISVCALFTSIKEQFDALGAYQNSLIQYVYHMTDAANVTLLYEAAESGIEASRKLHDICADIIDEAGANPKFHEYYAAISGKQSLFNQFSERKTRLCLIYLELFDLHAENSWNAYKLEQDGKMMEFADIHTLSKYHKVLEEKLGKGVIAKIDDMLIENMVCVQVMRAFRQGLINEYLYVVNEMNTETGKPIFEPVKFSL